VLMGPKLLPARRLAPLLPLLQADRTPVTTSKAAGFQRVTIATIAAADSNQVAGSDEYNTHSTTCDCRSPDSCIFHHHACDQSPDDEGMAVSTDATSALDTQQ
jgi:hypothetical protein